LHSLGIGERRRVRGYKPEKKEKKEENNLK
jgi:hypothetical protein